MHHPSNARSRHHSHIFDEGNPLAERNTLWAVILTAVMMVIEIVGGWAYNSMALMADGWPYEFTHFGVGIVTHGVYRCAKTCLR